MLIPYLMILLKIKKNKVLKKVNTIFKEALVTLLLTYS